MDQEEIIEEISIPELVDEEVNRKTKRNTIIMFAILVFASTASFGLGRLSKLSEQKVPITIELPKNVSAMGIVKGESVSVASAGEIAEESSGTLVGSKSGSKYHFPWCSGAQRIKEENKIFFADKAEAEAAGYTPAANCKGL